jgi:plasmid stabilization system protein ParE
MSLELIIRPEAEADVREAYRWYNEQLPGLGQELLAELDREFASLLASPEVHAKVHRDLRRA